MPVVILNARGNSDFIDDYNRKVADFGTCQEMPDIFVLLLLVTRVVVTNGYS